MYKNTVLIILMSYIQLKTYLIVLILPLSSKVLWKYSLSFIDIMTLSS